MLSFARIAPASITAASVEAASRAIDPPALSSVAPPTDIVVAGAAPPPAIVLG